MSVDDKVRGPFTLDITYNNVAHHIDLYSCGGRVDYNLSSKELESIPTQIINEAISARIKTLGDETVGIFREVSHLAEILKKTPTPTPQNNPIQEQNVQENSQTI